MGCKNCKEREPIRHEIERQTNRISKIGIWIVIIWSLLGLFGFYSLIKIIFK